MVFAALRIEQAEVGTGICCAVTASDKPHALHLLKTHYPQVDRTDWALLRIDAYDPCVIEIAKFEQK